MAELCVGTVSIPHRMMHSAKRDAGALCVALLGIPEGAVSGVGMRHPPLKAGTHVEICLSLNHS